MKKKLLPLILAFAACMLMFSMRTSDVFAAGGTLQLGNYVFDYEPPILETGVPQTATMSGEEDYAVCFRFTPQESGDYAFYSSSDEPFDSGGFLYDTDGNKLTAGGRSSINKSETIKDHFHFFYTATAGKTYYLIVTDDSFGTEGDIQVWAQKRLKAYPEGETSTTKRVYVGLGKTQALKVIAEPLDYMDLTYRWEVSGHTLLAENKNGVYEVTGDAEKYIYCSVYDQYDNWCEVSFRIEIDNSLIAYPEGAPEAAGGGHESTMEVQVPAMEDHTLKALAEGTDTSSLTYSWGIYNKEKNTYDVIPDQTEPTLTINIDDPTNYRCAVKDQFGNFAYAIFKCKPYKDNHLTVYPEGAEKDPDTGRYSNKITLKGAPLGEVDMRTIVEADDTRDLTYTWYHEMDGTNWQLAVTKDTCGAEVDEYTEYSCKVTDRYGNSAYAYFSVVIDPDYYALEATAGGDTTRTIKPGEETVLTVNATTGDTNNLEYKWYLDDSLISDASGNSCTASQAGTYKCKISNSQKTVVVEFTVIVDDSQEPDDPTTATEDTHSSTDQSAPSEKPVTKPAVTKKSVRSIRITAPSTRIAAGKAVQLKVAVTPADASKKSVTWISGNPKVAKVSASGKVSILKKTGGKKVVITAKAKDGSGVKSSITIYSMKGIVKKIKVTGPKTVKAGKTIKLKAKVKASKGANKKLEWISSKPAYATVKNGKVKALPKGKGKTLKITARALDGSNKKTAVKINIK